VFCFHFGNTINIYNFKNIFTNEVIQFSQIEVAELFKLTLRESEIINKLFSTNYNIVSSENFFKEANKANFENKLFEIQYIDKTNNITKRIVFIDDKSTFTSDNGDPLQILSTNCILRNGKIRHFNVSRILKFKNVPSEFARTFLTMEPPIASLTPKTD